MHPEVEEFISKNKKKWNPWQIAIFEDLKQTFPNKSLDWGLHVLNKYLKPEIILRDVDRGVEVWMEMDVVKKIAPIVEKYGLGKLEQRTALAMIATENAVKNEMREEMREEMRSHNERMKDVLKMLDEQNKLIRKLEQRTPSPHMQRRSDFWFQYNNGLIDPSSRNQQPRSVNTVPTTKPKIGRPSKEFEEYLRDDAPENLMDVLEHMLDGKTGKEAFSIILAIQDEYLAGEPEDKCICRKFPSIAPNSYGDAKNRHYGRNKYIEKATPIDEWRLASIRREIKEKLDSNQ